MKGGDGFFDAGVVHFVVGDEAELARADDADEDAARFHLFGDIFGGEGDGVCEGEEDHVGGGAAHFYD